jgi:hypothetical protein
MERREGLKGEESNRVSAELARNATGSSASRSRNRGRSAAETLTNSKQNSSAIPRRATGPRTPIGKNRSRNNAVTHGIFSSVVLLKGESRKELDALLNGFRESFRPEGTAEEVLVDKLAMLVWRHRRLVIAEGAEIGVSTEFLEWDEECRQTESANEILRVENPGDTSQIPIKETGGLIRHIANPMIASECLDWLRQLQKNIKADGFHPEPDLGILRTLYGSDPHLRQTVLDPYCVWLETANWSEEERRQSDHLSHEECVANVLEAIVAEIKRIVDYGRRRATIDSAKIELNRLRLFVPKSPDLDRLLKYEASLERAFDRTLAQLERLQRMRLGQAVLPAIKVDLSS